MWSVLVCFVLFLPTISVERQSLVGEVFVSSDGEGNLLVFVDRSGETGVDGFVDAIFYIQADQKVKSVQRFAAESQIDVDDGSLTLLANDRSLGLFAYFPGRSPAEADLAAIDNLFLVAGHGISRYDVAPFSLAMSQAMEEELYLAVFCTGNNGGVGSTSCSVTCPATYVPISCSTSCATGFYASCGCHMVVNDVLYDRACCRCN